MGDTMIRRYTKIIFPNKKINILVILVLFMGVILGSIFANIINMNDRLLVIDKIKVFIENINGNSIDSFIAFKNSLSINLLYILLISLFSLAVLGIIFNLILLFIKGFILGFSIASFIIAYHYKGIILSFLYLLLGQVLNILIVIIISIYGMMVALKLFKMIIKENGLGIRRTLKNYLIILVLAIIISLISAVGEAFLLPASIKLIIKLFI